MQSCVTKTWPDANCQWLWFSKIHSFEMKELSTAVLRDKTLGDRVPVRLEKKNLKQKYS